eukprot:Partr_v1_DN28378_c0_g1_i2_m78613 putative exportin-1
MEAILDFSRDLDVSLFDRVVNALYSGAGQEQKMAQSIISQFQDHPEAWGRVDLILTTSQSLQTKYIALQVLERLIQTKWKILPREQGLGIRDFIVGTIIKISSDEAAFIAQRVYLNKLNLILVQILKHEWPKEWPDFIPEIVASSRTSLSLCENNMVILKLLSEEIFDFSADQMTSLKAKNLKNQMCGEFSSIFQLCDEVLQRATKESLIRATLETLLRFLNWIPLGYIFETKLIEMLRSKFLEVPAFRNVTVKCLTEIGSLAVPANYNPVLSALYFQTVQSLNNILPMTPALNIAAAYENGNDEEQEFVQNMALFLTSYLSEHLTLVEQEADKQPLFLGHRFLLKISRVEDREIFKICLEYWTKLVAGLYNELPSHVDSSLVLSVPQPARKMLYAEILEDLRLVMIETMVKPEEVLIVENDEGEIVREFVKETDTITLYKSMREVLVYLTHLDVDNTEGIISRKLERQMDGSEWSWNNLNRLCWAIGSISGAMSEESEKRFLVFVIKDLLSLTEMKRGKDNKAVVASNIMYVVGQYPRFLRAHWKFLKTVVNKLFEFMHETHEGVQDMACDTFIKIAQKCRRHFVVKQAHESQPFVEEIIQTLPAIIGDLTPSQIQVFYEAMGCMINSQVNRPEQDTLIMSLMEGPNTAWDDTMKLANQNADILNSPDAVKNLSNIIKTNVAACTSIGSQFIVQIARIFMDMLNLYRATSEMISRSVAEGGVIQTKTPRVRGLRSIKKEILKLLQVYISKAEDLQMVVDNLIPPLLEAVLGDYQRNVEPARDAEVLSLMTAIVVKLGPLMTDKVGPILDSVFECTLNMINKDFQEYPEHRVSFYNMLRAINQNCFPALLNLPPQVFKLVLDSIVWAFKHTMRDIADTGLQICMELLTNVGKLDNSVASAFYQSYFISIFQDVFYVLTDREHKSGFKFQAQILAQMCIVVDSGVITLPLYQPGQVADPTTTTNQQFIREYLMQLLLGAFPNLKPQQVHGFVQRLFQQKGDMANFKQQLRDFLIQLQEYAVDDNSELYLEEKELELEQKKLAEISTAKSIPGMLKPHEQPDEMED